MKETPFLESEGDFLAQCRSMPFLQSLDEKDLSIIVNTSKLRQYEPHELIIRLGDQDKWIYLLISGEVTVHQNDGKHFNLQSPGDLFGEMTLVDSKRRSASVKAVYPTTCMAIDGAGLSSEDPTKSIAFYAILYRLLGELLASRLRETNDQISRLQMERDTLKSKLFH